MVRALVLSGGGAFGAYQVGVLKRLFAEDGPWYGAFCGVSVGALNAAFLAQFNHRDLAIDRLDALWLNLKQKDIYKRWFPFGKLHGLWKTGLYNTQPLRDLVHQSIKLHQVRYSDNELRIGTVNLHDNQYSIFDQNSPDLHKAIVASAAFPVMFPTVKINGAHHVDGGAREITPLTAAFRIPGVTAIDVVLTRNTDIETENRAPKNALQAGLMSVEAMLDETLQNDIKIAKLYNKLAKLGVTPKRNVEIRIFKPSKILEGNSLEFNQKHIQELIKLGYDDTKLRLE